MTTKRFAASWILAVAAASLMTIPAMVFIGAALYHGMEIPAILVALGDQYTAEKQNLLVVSVLGLVPLLLIALLLFVRKLIRKSFDGSDAYAWGGVIPVLLVTVFVNLEYWPSYLPARNFLGFPHGLEFVIGPFVFAPIGVLLGFVLTWFLRKQN